MPRRRLLSPRARGRIAALGTSLLTSDITAPLALWALAPPQRLDHLALALGATGLAVTFGILVGRNVTQRAAEEEASG